MTGFGLRRSTSWAALLAFFTSLTACGGGQDTAPPPTTLVSTTLVPTTVVPTTAPAPTLPAQPPEQLSKQQMRELVAPVALYPDVVLASLLPATTYPEQVTDAAGWLRQQNGQVQAVPDDRNWDGSVAGLLQFPDVLNWLDQNDAWEDQMGTAMTYQQGDVLQAIQDYRQEALNAGNLKSNEYMKVSAQPNQDIQIAPAQPDVVYVPQYDTQAVTQPQQSTGINPWLAFGGGAVVGALGAWALYSIFDDDDDDHHHGGGGHKKVVKQYNNYYYSGSGNRPQPVNWQPRQGNRQRWRANEQVARPRNVEPVYNTRTAAQKTAAVQPPKQGKQGNAGGQHRRGGVEQPTTAPPVGSPQSAAPKGGGHKQGGGGGGGQKQKQGGGQKQHQQNTQQQNRTPAPAPTAAPSTREGTKAPQQVQQKKQGGGGGGGGKQGGGQNQQNKKKKKKGGDND
jgi:hypothetical protein